VGFGFSKTIGFQTCLDLSTLAHSCSSRFWLLVAGAVGPEPEGAGAGVAAPARTVLEAAEDEPQREVALGGGFEAGCPSLERAEVDPNPHWATGKGGKHNTWATDNPCGGLERKSPGQGLVDSRLPPTLGVGGFRT